jgi:pimeloyl-ACP methyl ester carboxylesterase
MGPDVGPPRPFDPALAARPQRTFADLDEVVAALRQRYPTVGARYLRRLARWSVLPAPAGRLTWKWDKRVRGHPQAPDEFRASLRALRCPTLIVRGGASGSLSAEGAAHMQTLIPDCRSVAIPRTGHCLAEERPAAFAAAVRAFLEEPARPNRAIGEPVRSLA